MKSTRQATKTYMPMLLLSLMMEKERWQKRRQAAFSGAVSSQPTAPKRYEGLNGRRCR